MTLDIDVAALASAILVFVVALVTISSGRKIARIERLHALAEKLPEPQKKRLNAVRDDLIERYVSTHRNGIVNSIQMVIYGIVFVVVAAAVIFTAVPSPDGYWPVEVINTVMATYFSALAGGLINSIVLYLRSRSKKTPPPATAAATQPQPDVSQSHPIIPEQPAP